jgi:hypothetical protein
MEIVEIFADSAEDGAQLVNPPSIKYRIGRLSILVFGFWGMRARLSTQSDGR